MLEQFIDHISKAKLVSKTSRILLAVSGGLDSMVMSHLFINGGFHIAVAHCNFQLRGKESEEDEFFVREYCHKKGVRFFSRRFDLHTHSAQHSLSIQMSARQVRYEWFGELLKQHNFDWLATAHHLNDSIETILLNWVNGSSLEQLTGIPDKNGKIIRPLLFTTREAILQYALENNVVWREDSSNQTTDYQRNFIRHEIIPKLRELNPSLERTLQHGIGKIKSEVRLCQQMHLQWGNDFVFVKSLDEIYINKKACTDYELSPPLLWRTLRRYGFNFDMCQKIARSCGGSVGKRFMSASHQLVIDREYLIITLLTNPLKEFDFDDTTENLTLGYWQLSVLWQYTGNIVYDSMTAILDAALITFPIKWRKWKAGDYFYPLGMSHQKKISDFLIDEKVPLSLKDQITVLECGGEIIWVVGYRIDNRFKVTENTRKKISIHVRYLPTVSLYEE